MGVFVLCTTEAHKIPATIASRCQSFSFRSVDFEEIMARMAWICGQEGIEADSEALAVLAQAGEGSVRDSLSALDQAIACCGAKLGAAEVRELLGAFSLESLEKISQALAGGDSRAMLEVVDELERNGRNLQHFSRELARYFRNLLVARIAGAETRLVAASAAQRQRMAEIAAGFSEEDLTRYCNSRSTFSATCNSRCSRGSIWKSAWFAWCRRASCCRLKKPWRPWVGRLRSRPGPRRRQSPNRPRRGGRAPPFRAG